MWIFRRFVCVLRQGIRPFWGFCLRRKTRYSGSWVPNTAWHFTLTAMSAVEVSKTLARFLCIIIIIIIIIILFFIYFFILFYFLRNRNVNLYRSQWPRGLWLGSAAAGLLGFRVRIPPVAWKSVCCEWCGLSGRGLCVWLITHPEGHNRLWCVWVWSWILDNAEALVNWGLLSRGINTLRTGDADLRFYITTVQDGWRICVFNTRLFSLHNTLNYAIHRACLRMVLLTDVYRNLTSLWIKL